MARDTITQFMWGFQRHFRRSVEFALQRSLEEIGVSVEPTVFLIGILREGGSRHPLCVEPEAGPVAPAEFDGLDDRAMQIYNEDPDSRMRFSDARSHDRKHQEFRDRAMGAAISEVLGARLGLQFFAGLPTPVEQHFVFTMVGLPEWVLDDAPQLTHETATGRIRLTRSLVLGVVDEILRLSSQALYLPDAGSGLDEIGAAADIARAAAERLTGSVVLLAGDAVGMGLFDGLNRVATMRYEKRVGVGSLLLAGKDSEYVDRSVTLSEPVRLSETRTLRKLLEVSSRDGEWLLTDGSEVYGLGSQKEDYPAEAESVFKLLVSGDGTWELQHGDVRLASVQHGVPRLPEERVRRELLDDICVRVFDEFDSDALWALVMSAADAEHGTMLVISAAAEAEASRLGSQSIRMEPATLQKALVQQATGIDGAVLVDPSGRCHAIGVILDGTATSKGDRSRGARFNSAVKYLASAEDKGIPTAILLVSEDGMINLVPDLRPRISRAELESMLDDLREAAAIEPVHPEQFYKAYRPVEAKAFYLAPEQIDEVNSLMGDHWERRMAAGGNLRVFTPPIIHDPAMNDGYFLDD